MLQRSANPNQNLQTWAGAADWRVRPEQGKRPANLCVRAGLYGIWTVLSWIPNFVLVMVSGYCIEARETIREQVAVSGRPWRRRGRRAGHEHNFLSGRGAG